MKYFLSTHWHVQTQELEPKVISAELTLVCCSHCSLSALPGYPDPEVMWFKDDQPVKESRHFQIDYDEEGNCSLTISEVCGDDDAKYTCKAVNSLGEATCTAELLVETMAKEGEGEGEEDEEEEEWNKAKKKINI